MPLANASEKASDVSDYNNLSDILDGDANERYHDQFIDYKTSQNNLPDIKRDKNLFYNQYWLVNKKQNLWMGFFDGREIKVPAGIYSNLPKDSYQPQQVIRIKENGRVLQFLLPSAVGEYPDSCLEKDDKIMDDNVFYTYFYSGCTYDSRLNNSIKHDGHHDILLYDKRFNTLVQLDSIPYAIPDGLKYMSESLVFTNGYYRFDSIQVAFKIIGKDNVAIVDPETGKYLPKVPKIDDNGNPVMKNGEQVMIDDPDGFQPVILKRLPEVTVAN